MDFNMIMVLDEGVIRESGTHEELLKKKGLYYEMYKLQQKESAGVEQKFG